jgi:hypothetical protein
MLNSECACVFVTRLPDAVCPLPPDTLRPERNPPMKHYEVVFRLNGHRYSEVVGATCSNDARRLVESRHPGCSIWHVRVA